jgi:hypothetical protein
MKHTTTETSTTDMANAFIAASLAAGEAKHAAELAHQKWVDLNRATLAAKVEAHDAFKASLALRAKAVHLAAKLADKAAQ